MEALLLPDQPISAHNRVRNRYASMSSFRYASMSSFQYPEIDSGNYNLSNHPNYAKDSLFGNPASLSFFSSFPSLQPPLLPLPLARNPSLPSKTRGLSPSPSPNTRKNKTKDQDSAPKKQKSATKKDSSRSSTVRLGPHPSKLPKEASMVFRSSSSSSSSSSCSSLKGESHDELDHSGSIFSLAPHPSSLPLPRFSLRPKPAGCNAEAGGSVNTGATSDLRRLLRLPQPLMRTGSSSGNRVSELFHP